MQIYEFKTLGMLSINEAEFMYNRGAFKVIVHDLYIEYATWFLELVNREKEVRGVWCVGKSEDPISSLPPELLRTPQTCWPDLERIRLENVRCDGFPVGKVQEWRNVVVLQIVECRNLTSINLHGLTCLRHLELKNLRSLNSLSFTTDGSSTSNVSLGTCRKSEQFSHMLKFVIIDRLDSLECLPSFSPCTSLKFLKIVGCDGLTQPPSVQRCAGLERMTLEWHPNQRTLPSLYGLTSLRDLTIFSWSPFLKGGPLNLEGLGSLISLGALELRDIPIGHLAGLENLTHVQYIQLVGLSRLTSFPSLINVETSSLHVLKVGNCYNIRETQEVVKLRRLINLKLDDLAQ